ncbi:MAG: histidine kinase dimerization/phospho-acceptor domain-containing protein [Rhodanobacter sp.]
MLSSVLHDLRSPLASMIGAAGILVSYEDKLPADERECVSSNRVEAACLVS